MVGNALHRTVETRYGRMSFFVNDTCAVRKSLELYGEWAENEITFVGRFIHPGDTVLDVGAYIGTHSIAFARRVRSAGRVVAFEAQPLAFELLERNILANSLSNVELRNAVAGESGGQVEIASIDVARPGAYGSASVRSELLPGGAGLDADIGQAGSRRVAVPTVTIDSLELKTCALIKIDAEGTEDVVLRGARETIARTEPVIYAECNSITDGMRCIEVLRTLGYEIRVHLVHAFNQNNFLGSEQNIFGNAREAAVLALPALADRNVPLRPSELLVTVETADDLALALLNKPQYPSEILAAGAAAKSGAGAWLEEMRRLHWFAREAVARGKALEAQLVTANERIDLLTKR